MNALYTAGYHGHWPRELASAARQLRAIVCDIRFKPQSRIPGWSGAELQQLLGKIYIPLAELGNVNAGTEKPIQLSERAPFGFERLLKILQKYNVILLCGCAEYSTCHRREVAELVQKTHGFPIQELAWPVSEAAAGTMKCISLWQPWASLIAWGEKRIETRSWATAYRGPLAIHAAKTSKGFDDIVIELEAQEKRVVLKPPFGDVLRTHGIETLKELPVGGVLGAVDLVDCVPTENLRDGLSTQELAFGDYRDGRFGWVLEGARALPEMKPYRGAQGLFNIPREAC